MNSEQYLRPEQDSESSRNGVFFNMIICRVIAMARSLFMRSIATTSALCCSTVLSQDSRIPPASFAGKYARDTPPYVEYEFDVATKRFIYFVSASTSKNELYPQTEIRSCQIAWADDSKKSIVISGIDQQASGDSESSFRLTKESDGSVNVTRLGGLGEIAGDLGRFRPVQSSEIAEMPPQNSRNRNSSNTSDWEVDRDYYNALLNSYHSSSLSKKVEMYLRDAPLQHMRRECERLRDYLEQTKDPRQITEPVPRLWPDTRLT